MWFLEVFGVLVVGLLMGFLLSIWMMNSPSYFSSLDIGDASIEDPMLSCLRKGILTCINYAELSPERRDLGRKQSFQQLKRKASHGLLRKPSIVQLDVESLGSTTDQYYEWNMPLVGQVRFIDHSPQVFRTIRQIVQMDLSTLQQELSRPFTQRGSHGKSDAAFFESTNHILVLKSLRGHELEHLKAFLLDYTTHIHSSESYLPLYLGLFSIERLVRYSNSFSQKSVESVLSGGTRYSFILTTNVFYTRSEKIPHFKFDFKGSTVGRQAFFDDQELIENLAPTDELFDKKSFKEMDYKILFDMDLMGKIHLGPAKHRLLDVLERDFNLLRKNGFMDYSVLIGVHRIKKKKRPMTVAITDFDPNDFEAQPSIIQNAIASVSHIVSIEEDRWVNKPIIGMNKNEVYYIGIVDALQTFNFAKWVEKEIKEKSMFMPRRQSTIDKKRNPFKDTGNLPSRSRDDSEIKSSTLPRRVKRESLPQLEAQENSVEEPERYAERLISFLSSITD